MGKDKQQPKKKKAGAMQAPVTDDPRFSSMHSAPVRFGAARRSLPVCV